MLKKHLLLAPIFILLGLSFFISCQEKIEKENNDTIPESTELYGIKIDSLTLYQEKIKPNQNLSQILQQYQVPMQIIDKVAKMSIAFFDVRKFKVGNNYTVICKKVNDSTEKVHYFVYEDGPVNLIIYDLRDSIHIHLDQKEIKKTTRTVTGVIESSLWNAFSGYGNNPAIAIQMSEIYAWSIDFFGLQKGDSFKVVFEESSVDGEQIGIGKIQSAVFNHLDSNYYAFYFVQDTVGEYFDQHGNSLRKAYLKAPLEFSRISSNFSHARLHPVHKVVRPHLGVDYAAPVGTPVRTIGNGTVISAGRSGGAGNMVKIKHNTTHTTAYLHLSKFGKGIRVGKKVKQGEVIGYVGSTGWSTGPHLDFRFYKNGQAINPLTIQSPPADPVSPKNKDAYFEKIIPQLLHLDSISIIKAPPSSDTVQQVKTPSKPKLKEPVRK